MSSPDHKDLSILIVDDEGIHRRILREGLKNLGFPKFKEADSGQFAIMTMTEQKFDLVLSDVQMPGMNGLELLRQIRLGQTKLPRNARFIVLTSFSNTEVLGAAMALDVNGFVAKPVKIGIVMEKIGRAIQETFQLRSLNEYESVDTNLLSLEEGTKGSMKHVPKEMPVSGMAEKSIPLTQLRVGMCVSVNASPSPWRGYCGCMIVNAFGPESSRDYVVQADKENGCKRRNPILEQSQEDEYYKEMKMQLNITTRHMNQDRRGAQKAERNCRGLKRTTDSLDHRECGEQPDNQAFQESVKNGPVTTDGFGFSDLLK